MEPRYYFATFIFTATVVCILTSLRFLNSPDYTVQEKGSPDILFPLLFCAVYIWFLGGRPVWTPYFGDSIHYGAEYLRLNPADVSFSWDSEWLWQWLMNTCKMLGLSVNAFFTLLAAIYFLSVLWAIKMCMPQNILLAMLFVVTSLMFYSFCVNGLRNGLACHLVLLAFAFILTDNIPAGALLCLAAFGIHRSVILPVASFVVAIYLLKDVKLAVIFWFASILISLVSGDRFTNLFASLGFDDRMNAYANLTEYDDQFSKTGFRWDFLLYSAMPIWMMWEVCVKRKISDNWYNALCVTYCLANSFWVLVIRAAFSNRFAYLSWFMYPFVVAYPLIMLPVWDDQDRRTAYILIAYVLFTIGMNIMWHNI